MSKEKEAIEKLNQFLKENPQMQSFQDEIDKMLSRSSSSEGRMKILQYLMAEKTNELSKHFSELTTTLKNIGKK